VRTVRPRRPSFRDRTRFAAAALGGGALLVAVGGAALLAAVGDAALPLPAVGAQDAEEGERRQEGPADSETVARYRRVAEKKGRPIDHYNLGTALLLDRRWVEAREPLQGALADERAEVQEHGLYNYGVTSALAGHEGQEEPETRRRALIAARQAFRQLLRDRPADEDVRWNLELVERWLEQEEQTSGGQGSAGGQAQSDPGGGTQGSSEAGDLGSDQRPLSPQEAAALLDSAGRAESDIRERMLGRTRYRDPVVEKNW